MAASLYEPVLLSGHAFGVPVKIKITANDQSGQDLLGFSNHDPNHIWVGPDLAQFDVNSNHARSVLN